MFVFPGPSQFMNMPKKVTGSQLRFSDDPRTERTLRHSIWDGIGYSVMAGGGENYFSAFAIFLKASVGQVAILASLPPLLGSFAQLFSIWMCRRRTARLTMIFIGALLQGICLLPMITLPILFPKFAVSLIIGCVILYYCMLYLTSPPWSHLMGDLVPEDRRGRYFGVRTRLFSITAFIALAMAGVVLDHLNKSGRTYTGYMILFSVAAAARFFSVYHIRRMHDPRTEFSTPAPWNLRMWFQEVRQSRFLSFALCTAMVNFSVALASPFFSVYILKNLGCSYFQFMCITASNVIAHYLTSNMWGKLSDTFGNRLVMTVTGLMIPAVPLLWLFSTDYRYLMMCQAFAGLIWAGYSLSVVNYGYDLVLPERRAGYFTLSNIFTNIAVLGGALTGGLILPLLPNQLNIGTHKLQWPHAILGLFLISGLVRFIVVLVFIPRLREVRKIHSISMGQLAFRIIRFNPISGLIFDVANISKQYLIDGRDEEGLDKP